ncbi:hypothetical protein [Stenotrophomonas nematodicola]|uniref:Uncharacterized protein n=1 Tax=Stenotrophomonas nematodicola TaxID=2656746 RepID=A0ABW7D0A6_9GAMM
MGSRRERREQRQALKADRFEQEKLRRISEREPDKIPQVRASSSPLQEPRLAPHLQRIKLGEAKISAKAQGASSRFNANVAWCETRADKLGDWTWGESRCWSDEEWTATIEPGKKNMCALTWSEVDKMSSDGGHKMHHGHEISDLAGEAQERWKELGYEEFGDSVFRFRVGGQKCRAWGYTVQAHFYMVWWEREHNIYPTSQR